VVAFRLDGIRAEWSISSGLTLAGTGAIAAVIVVVIYFVTHDDSSPKQVEVPNLVGMQRGAGEAELSERGLSLRATYDQASDQPAGTVLRTDPTAGTKLDRGQSVSLMLASAVTGTEPGSSQTTVIQPDGCPTRPDQTSSPGAGGGTVTSKPNTNRQVPAVIGHRS
jgi:beta-lactam-binding protein with PASTA domain